MDMTRAARLLWLCSSVALAAPDLRVDMQPMLLRSRTAGPVPVELRFRWSGAQLLEGRVEMVLRAGNRVVGDYRTHDMALTTGEQGTRLLLPALPPTYENEIEVGCRFVSGSASWTMPPQFLLAPPETERSLVMAVCGDTDPMSQELRDLEYALRLDRFDASARTDPKKRKLAMTLARFAPEDLPAQPLAYCAYDAVLLTTAGLAGLRERQRAALRRWVEAGGSVCLWAPARVDAEHVEFLNELDGAKHRFQRDGSDRLTPAGITLVHSELGRTAVIAGPAAALGGADSVVWREAAAFLWKVRKSAREAMMRDGVLPTTPDHELQTEDENAYDEISNRHSHAQRASFAAPSSPLYGRLVDCLMPSRTRMIPFSMVGGLLTLFVVLIGPVDWWVLGWLKRRRYTWVLFPLVTAGVTLAMVRMANHYLGQTDHRGAMTVVDVGRDGRILRQDRYALVFTGRDRAVVQDVRDGLWSASTVRSIDNESYQYRRYARASEGDAEPCRMEGLLPGRYRVSRMVRQWRPEITRLFALEPPAAEAPPIRWDVVDNYVQSKDPPRDLLKELFGVGSRKADVFVYRRAGRRNFVGGSLLPERVVTAVCAPPPRGVFALLSQLSPTGGGNADDLAVYDESDKSQCAVAIVMRTGDEITLYRRSYYGL